MNDGYGDSENVFGENLIDWNRSPGGCRSDSKREDSSKFERRDL